MMALIKSKITLDKIRDFLLKIFSKEFLVFLSFLALSGGFWLLMTLNNTYEYELTVGLKLIDVPKNVVITEEPDSVVRFTVRDKGFVVASYEFFNELKPVQVSFRLYNDGRNKGEVAMSDIQRQISQQLHKSTRIISLKVNDNKFSFNYGQHKLVPVKMLGQVVPNNNYNLAQARFYPEMVSVYADKATLDSIQSAYTVHQHITNFTDAKEVMVELRKIPKAKCVPNVVKMKLIPDVLTEEDVEVPIEAINLPKDKLLRTFPSKIKVKFIVGAYRLRSMPRNNETKELLPVGFKVVADYKSIMDGKSSKCPISISNSPESVHNVRLETRSVDYVIEQR